MKNIMSLIWKIAGILIAVGAVLALIGWLSGGRSEQNISAEYRYTELSNTVAERNVKSLVVDSELANIYLIPGDTLRYEIHVLMRKDSDPEVTVEGDTLKITAKDKPRTIFGWGVNFNWGNLNNVEESYIKVYYPKDMNFDEVTLIDGLGSITAGDFNANNLIIKNNNGSVAVQNVKSNISSFELDLGSFKVEDSDLGQFEAINSNGSITVTSVSAGKTNIKLGLGSLTVTDSELGGTVIDNNNGSVTFKSVGTDGADITLSLGSAKLHGEFRGVTVIENSNGKVEIETSISESDYSYDLKSDLGSVHVNGDKRESSDRYRNDSAANNLTVKCDLGSIKVSFDR